MSILQPPGDATGSDRSNGTPATPGPSHRRPTESSRGRGRGMAKKQRDERDFETPESLRGIIQGLEESRNRSDKKMEDRFEIIMGAINRLTQRVDETESRARTRPSVEQSPTRSLPSEAERPTPNPSDFRTTVPEAGSSRTAGATYDSFLQPPNLRNLYETSPTPTINNARSKLTEKIEPLGDGTDPSFRQWRISIRDRFVVNADHYTSEVTRKALIWSTTTGLARSYLEPRYQSDHQDFRSADEMIRTLESYFTTGYETEEYRNQFHDMVMGEKGHANETFPEFTARFRSMAVLGNVSEADWFYQLWDKITPQLRNASTASKHLWKHNFQQMVLSLTSIDMERRRNFDRNPSSSTRNPSSGTNKPLVANSSTASKSSPKPFRPFSSSGPATTPKPPSDRPKFSTTPIRPPVKPIAKDACFLCGKTGHFKAQCPELPSIRALISEIDEAHGNDPRDQEDEDNESGPVREGNEEA